MEAPRPVCAFLESWDARQGGIRVKAEDELSMPAEKAGYASDIPAPLLVFFLGIFRVVISYFIRCNSRGRYGWGALSKTVENGVGMTHLFCKHCAAASSQSVRSSSFTLMLRVVSVEVYVLGGVLKGRHCNSFYGFYSKLDNQV